MLSNDLQAKIEKALKSVEWGSVEIIVQKNHVTQISVRNISKTNLELHTDSIHTVQRTGHRVVLEKKKTSVTSRMVIGLES